VTFKLNKRLSWLLDLRLEEEAGHQTINAEVPLKFGLLTDSTGFKQFCLPRFYSSKYIAWPLLGFYVFPTQLLADTAFMWVRFGILVFLFVAALPRKHDTRLENIVAISKVDRWWFKIKELRPPSYRSQPQFFWVLWKSRSLVSLLERSLEQFVNSSHRLKT
jgi:hypothetical protein